MCAAPLARPPHVAKTRDVAPAEVEAALVTLCEEEAAHLEATPEPLAVLHEALAQDRAVTGNFRRSSLLIDAARIDLGAVQAGGKAVQSAEEALAKRSAGWHCTPSWPGLDRFLLEAARAQNKSGQSAQALERCADVVALARDEHLTGDMTDMLLANSHIQRAVESCRPLLDAAPKEAAAKLAASLTVLRATFPSSLDDVLARDRAEMMLFSFGRGRDPSRPFSCERANALAKANEGPPLTRGDRVGMDRAWREVRAQNLAPSASYNEAYTLTLRVLDQLIERANSR